MPRSVKTRLQVQEKRDHAATHASDEPHYTSMWDAISKITAEDGLPGLYAGMHGSLLGVASTNFAYFYWYSTVRTLYLKTAPAGPSTLTELGLGAVAGALAQLCTIPVAVVTTRQQTQAKHERKSFLETGREVIEGEDGVCGLWRGLKASLVLVVNPAITYGAYERLKTRLFPNKTRLTPAEAFRKPACLSASLPSPSPGRFCALITPPSFRRPILSVSVVCVCVCMCASAEVANVCPLSFPSAGRHVQGAGHHRDAAPDRRQGRPAVQAAAVAPGQALQGLRRGHAVHHQERGPHGPIQGHRPADPQGLHGPGHPDDDQGEVRIFSPSALPLWSTAADKT